jgi:2-amino-4-ketopentanoate thiolase alpha subunit
MVKKGSWVQIHNIVLNSDERAPQVPDDTKQVPLEMWVKGTLLEDGEIGDQVKIKTVTGRIEMGQLVAYNPTFTHTYGEYVPEIFKIGSIVKEIIGDDQE